MQPRAVRIPLAIAFCNYHALTERSRAHSWSAPIWKVDKDTRNIITNSSKRPGIKDGLPLCKLDVPLNKRRRKIQFSNSRAYVHLSRHFDHRQILVFLQRAEFWGKIAFQACVLFILHATQFKYKVKYKVQIQWSKFKYCKWIYHVIWNRFTVFQYHVDISAYFTVDICP